MKTSYRNTVGEAMLTLETRIRDRLALADEIIGVHLVDEARNRDIFKRTVKAEEDGLYMLFRGAMLYSQILLATEKLIIQKKTL